MKILLCKTFLSLKLNNIPPPTWILHASRKPHVFSTRFLSATLNEQSFTVSYLINSCGLTPESALAAAKLVKFKKPDKPDAIIKILRNWGFSQTQISSLVRKSPRLLLSKPEKTLLPKLEFFHSKGVSGPDLVKIVSNYPLILHRNLEKRLVPSFNFFRDILGSDEKVMAAVKRFTKMLDMDLDTSVVRNIRVLRENGVPKRNIITMLQYQPRTLMLSPDLFKEAVEKANEMGFNPARLKFSLAAFAFRAMNKSTWEKKMKAYNKWGLSEEEVLSAFKKQPWCVLASEDKIMGLMDFFVNQMGLKSSFIVQRPQLMTLSMNKRLIPRASVLKALLSKELPRSNFSVLRFFECSERHFLEKYVNIHEKEAPELLQIYEEKRGLPSV